MTDFEDYLFYTHLGFKCHYLVIFFKPTMMLSQNSIWIEGLKLDFLIYNRAMKLGIAIRPLSVSAMFQTKSSEDTQPTTITTMKII